MNGVPYRPLFSQLGRWIRVHPGDPQAKALLTRYRLSWLGRCELVTRPGATAVTLITPTAGVCVWKEDGHVFHGIRLAVLHNEHRRRVWRLLHEASEHAETVWPGRRQYTLLSRRMLATRAKTLDRAGWTSIGPQPGNLWIRERTR